MLTSGACELGGELIVRNHNADDERTYQKK